MYPLKKPFRLSIHTLLLTLLFGGLLAHPFNRATSSPPGNDRDYVLVINTYTESSLWSRNIVSQIMAHIRGIDNCEVYTENMNMSLMNRRPVLEDFKQILAREYGTHPPRMLVLLGSPSAILRDFIKETWPGVAIVYCSERDYLGPDEAYLDKRPVERDRRRYIRDYMQEDNITILQAPIYLRENIRLMQRMLPGMDSLVFVGSGRYVDQQTGYDLRELIAEEFPGIHYRFFSSTEMTAEALLDSLDRLDTFRTGVLFASWSHISRIGDNLFPVMDSYRVIASTQTPMFGLHPTGMRDSGLLGGYIYDDAEYNRRLIAVIDAVLAGEQPRNIPFYVPQNAGPVFNYSVLEHSGIPIQACPPDTLFFNKPASALERYKWPLLVVGLAMLGFIVIQQLRIRMLRNVEAARRSESESLAKYSSLFNNMPIVYIQQKVLFGDDGRPVDAVYCDINQRFEHLFLPREAAIGKKTSELMPESLSEFMRLVEMVLTENRSITYPYYHRGRDIFYEVIISRSYQPGHVDIFCLDNTALYKTQQKLNSINRKLSMALDVADIVPWKWDLQRHTILCDMTKEMRSRLPDGEAEEMQITVPEEEYFATIHKDDRERVRRACDDLIAGRTEKIREEFRVASADNGRHMDWVEVQAVAESRDEAQRAQSLVGSSLVITPRKRMEQDLLSARDRAEESNKLKSAFLANMSHEIRTPLNAIVGFSGILAETEEQQERQEYISIIENNNALLLQLIGDILDLSKIEAGTLDFITTDFDLDQLMREKENIVRMRVAEGVELKLETPGEGFPIRTDRNRLSQVLGNLLTNAAKFTREGSIRFGYEQRGEELYFHVTDTGCGISAENQPKVFERFVKLNTFKQGTGLGLPICKTIVEHLGGRIGVNSAGTGHGSTFWFTLPYMPGATDAALPETLPTISVQKDKLTLLIAEDNDSNYRLFESILRHDYRLLHAWNGEEAVELFRRERPHLVLMDINMPRMNGYEATAEIRKLSADVPIVAVTAFAYASDEQRVMQSGFNGYMPKPINAPQLKKQILEILRKHMTLI